MKQIIISLLTIAFATSLSAENPPPEGKALSQLIEAVAKDDVKTLKTLFVPRLTKEFEEMGWKVVMGHYKKAFQKHGFLDVDLSKVGFKFVASGEKEGKVYMTSDGKTLLPMRLMKVKERWLLNER